MDRAALLQQGVAHQAAGRFHEAEVLYRRMLAADPGDADAWHCLGLIAHRAGQAETAIEYLRHAIGLAPGDPAYHNNLATLHEERGEYDLAVECLRRAIALRPGAAAYHNNLGEVSRALGRVREALDCYRTALEHDPDFAPAQSNFLMLLNYDPDTSPAAVAEAHRKWGERQRRGLAPAASFANDRDPERRLRIGYISPDFRRHAVARFFEPVLAGHDRDRSEVFLYSEAPVVDEVGQRLRSLADGWRPTWKQPTAAVVDQVRADGIDLLVDLAGHTRHHRLDVFARRAAPVQATYLGYPNTTGLTTIDYRLVDAVLDPPGASTWTSERLVRLPGASFCFAPPRNAPPVAPPPCLASGRITLGSHHAPIKLNDRVLRCWSEALAGLPGARLLLLRHTLSASMIAELHGRLEAQGIAADRVVMRPSSADESEYLAAYGEMDLVLDSFPFSGHTTTCEALWMGVPVVTLRGDRTAARLSASVLTRMGLDGFIAETSEEYVALVQRHARDVAGLARLRESLRPRVRDALGDGPSFTGHLEAAYRQMWRDWCAAPGGAGSGGAAATFGTRVAPGFTAQPTDLSALLEAAGVHQHEGRFAEAEQACRQVLAAAPEHPAAWHRLGLLAREAGRWDDAIACFERSVRVDADAADTLNDLGIALARRDRLDEARACFERALRLRPDLSSVCNNLANVFRRLGRLDEAERALDRAIRLDPTAAELHLAVGRLLRSQGRRHETLAGFRNACRFGPDWAEAHLALGDALFEAGRPEEALGPLERATELAPSDAEAPNALGNVLRQLGREAEAVARYCQALEANPGFGPAHANLANLLAEQGRTEEARARYREAFRLQPMARLHVLSETVLPVLYDSMDQLRACRERLAGSLDRLNAEGVRLDPTRELMPTLFYLAYQGLNDRDLHAALARLADGPRRLDVRPAARPAGGKIRIGILSAHLRQHTIGLLNHGLIEQLDRDRFEVIVLTTGAWDDPLARRIRRAADHAVEVPGDVGAALQAIAGLGLDILYLTDVGMDALTSTLAFSRLAPVQCATWGHPVTTGLPTVDYFISSRDLELPEADSQYTERLVRLPRLAVCYDRPAPREDRADRSAFGLPPGAHLYVCPQTLFKFHPEFDAILGAILRADPAGLLVLIEGKFPQWTDRLRRRFSGTLGEEAARVRFLPPRPRERFLDLLAVADVMLDPIHFGGGNTSYEALAQGVPIVTLPSSFLRGRLTYALYRQMGLPDLVAADGSDYARRAVALGTDADHREAMRRRIREAGGILYDDVAAIRDLEAFFVEAVTRARRG